MHKPASALIAPFLFHHWFLFALLVVLFISYIAIEVKFIRFQKYAISNAKLTQLINNKSVSLLDIRPAEFFKTGHIKGSISHDIALLVKHHETVDLPHDKPVVLISGLESDCLKAIPILKKQGFTQFHCLGHGIQGWKKDNLPFTTVKTKTPKAPKKLKSTTPKTKGKPKND